MDYDDNDFQSQNFELVGEDNKFLPSLPAYAFPKYDIDENLRFHLDFSPLDEKEGFFGIQSQQDNDWIEDFSRGSSGIEFSSSAAESCSISRHNNGWSEATSSVSVETILKSVEQDERLIDWFIVGKSDVSGVDGLTDQMDSNLVKEHYIPSMTPIVNACPTEPPDKSVKHLPRDKTVKSPCDDEAAPQPCSEQCCGFDSPVAVYHTITEKCGLDRKIASSISSVEEKYIDDDHCSAASGEASCYTGNNILEIDRVHQFAEPAPCANVGSNKNESQVQVKEGLPEFMVPENLELSQNDAEKGKIISFHDPQIKDEVDNSMFEVDSEISCRTNGESNDVGGTTEEMLITAAEGVVAAVAEDENAGIIFFGKLCNSLEDVEQKGETRVSQSGMKEMLHHKSEMTIFSSDMTSVMGIDEVVESDTGNPEAALDVSVGCIEVPCEASEKKLSHSVSGEIDNDDPGSQGQNARIISSEKVVNSLVNVEQKEEINVSPSGLKEIQHRKSEITIFSSDVTSVSGIVEGAESDTGNPQAAFDVPGVCCEVPCEVSEKKLTDSASGKNDNDDPDSQNQNARNISSQKVVNPLEVVEQKEEIRVSPSGMKELLHHKSAITIFSSDVASVSGEDQVVENDIGTTEAAFDVPGGCIEVPCEVSEIRLTDSDCRENEVDNPDSQGQNVSTSSIVIQGLPSQNTVVNETVSEVVTGDALPSSTNCVVGNEILTGNDQGGDVVIVMKETERPCLLVSNTVDVDKKEGSVSEVFLRPCSVVSEVDSGEHVVSGNAEFPSETVVQSTASGVESINSHGNDEHQARTAAQEHSKNMDECLNLHISATKENDISEACPIRIEAKEISSGDIPPHTVALHIEKIQKDNEGASSPKNDNCVPITSESRQGQVANLSGESFGDLSPVIPALESNILETNCGSPTIISSNEQSQLDETATTDLGKESFLTDRNADTVKSSTDDASYDDRNFTFKVASVKDIPERDNKEGWKPFSNIQPSELLQIKKGLQTPGLCQTVETLLQEDDHGSNKVSKEDVPMGTVKAATGNKRKSASRKVPAKGTATKEKVAAKETSYSRRKAERDGNIGGLNSSSAGLNSNSAANLSLNVQLEEIQLSPNGESSKQSGSSVVLTANLPDLNSLLSSTLFHQPFTDLQQVQLRAQIFVYGWLIQGTTPDEACMVAAFSDSSQDGGRSTWESTWRIAVERLNSPLTSRTGSEVSEQVIRCDSIQNKTPASQACNKGTLPPNMTSSSMTLSSPLWSNTFMSQDALPSNTPRGPLLDYYHSLSLLHPYQSPQMKQYMGNTLPWLSQPSVSSSPWYVPPQSSMHDVGRQYSALSIAEAVQVTSVRELSTPNASSVELTLSSTSAPSVVPANNVSAASSVPLETKGTQSLLSSKIVSQKSRKRSKNSSSEVIQAQLFSQSPKEVTSIHKIASKSMTSAAAVPIPASSILSASSFVTGSPNYPSTNFQIGLPGKDGRKALVAAETFSRIELTKLQAEGVASISHSKLQEEDATSIATSAIRHCQDIWNQLSIQKNSGLISETEAELASAAVAAAAAASVAKTAAAAAKIASDAAFRAKLMADEAIKFGNPVLETNLKCKERACSSSIMVAAREAAKKRVEAACAAAKRAENLDAIVKAAELAAESVAQAGTIVAMGGPVPLKLSELLEAGPEGYWRLKPVPVKQRVEQSNLCHEDEIVATRKHAYGGSLSKKGFQETVDGGKEPASCEVSPPLGGNVRGMRKGSLATDKNLRQQTREESGLENPLFADLDVRLEAPALLADENDDGRRNQLSNDQKQSDITEGSTVEVLSNEDGFRGTWFSAKVIILKDEKAFVCYDELCEGKGTDRLKEWIPLKAEGDEPPRLRIAGPVVAPVRYERTRKRRRAAMGNHMWSVGDRVDVWMHGGWREASITHKDEEDDTKFTVQFSAQGDSSVVRAWSLRPSFQWKDGKWVECLRQKGSCLHEGDTPQDKRQKVGRDNAGSESKTEDRMKGKVPKDLALEDSRKLEESWSPRLSENDKIFSMGETLGAEKKNDPVVIKRTGLQKEGAKVIFGIPKPGKKRKFMDVSKHYVADKAAVQTTEGTDLMKFTKYLMPQASSRGWRNAPKVDSRGMEPCNSKPKVTRSGKVQTTQTKSVSKGFTPGLATQDSMPNVKVSADRKENNSSTQKLLEVNLPSNSQAVVTSDVLSLKNFLPPVGRAETEEKSSCHDAHQDNPVLNPVEPRRSNRRFQPTSRLLEGLQSSSLVVSKMPVLSHDKEAKLHLRNDLSSKGSNHG